MHSEQLDKNLYYLINGKYHLIKYTTTKIYTENIKYSEIFPNNKLENAYRDMFMDIKKGIFKIKNFKSYLTEEDIELIFHNRNDDMKIKQIINTQYLNILDIINNKSIQFISF